jgi:hypothetical protein
MAKQTSRHPKLFTQVIILLVSSCVISLPHVASGGQGRVDEDRVTQIAALLAERPAGFGMPISERGAWRKLRKNDSFRRKISDAQELLDKPIPDLPDDLYLDFSRTGNRTRWQRVSGRRRGRIGTLVLAECLENKGRFVPAFEELVRAICSERTWVLPAHDARLTNFHGKEVDIDLGSSMLAWSLATADYLLGDKLSPEIRRLIRDNLEKRIFQPYRDMVTGTRKKNWWMTTTNNWNAVCLAGVTGSALAVLDSKDTRAFYVAAAEDYSKNFLRGFTDDGYCSEGLGYWNYGFGYYAMLSEMILQATDGKLDLMRNEKARQAANFGSKIEIANGVYPAFADCSVRAKPSSSLMYYVSRHLGMGLSSWDEVDPVSSGGSLYQSMMYSFPNSASKARPARSSSSGPGIRSWFDKAGVLICRPASNTACRLAVALKGGHNNEHHNHNDVGSFVVVLGDEALLLDPGGEVYTARTFSSRRYDSKVLNSFGHPVPRVAGELQLTGSRARGKVVHHEFTDSADTLILDISSAYDVPQLRKLERTFAYSRSAAGSLTVTDEVTFSRPCDFGTALVTFDKWKQVTSSSLTIFGQEEALSVNIAVSGAGFEIKPETIKEDLSGGRLPTRLAINLTRPVTHAVVSLTIAPQRAP